MYCNYSKTLKWCFYDNRKKSYVFPPPPLPPPSTNFLIRLSGKIFLGHLKKNIVQRNVAEKKIIASKWGMKKNSCTEKLPNPPPPQKSNGPSLMHILSPDHAVLIRKELKVNSTIGSRPRNKSGRYTGHYDQWITKFTGHSGIYAGHVTP